MSWRGSTTVSDRVFACLPYLLPVVVVSHFGQSFLSQFPALGILFLPLSPLVNVYSGVPYAGLIIFLCLWLLVVRSEKISHFIRFNTMQALLLDIVIFLFSILIDVIWQVTHTVFVAETLSTTIFLGILLAVGYSTVYSLMGRYAEIPAISEAVYSQVR